MVCARVYDPDFMLKKAKVKRKYHIVGKWAGIGILHYKLYFLTLTQYFGISQTERYIAFMSRTHITFYKFRMNDIRLEIDGLREDSLITLLDQGRYQERK